MADTKISQLPSATTPLAGAELVPLVQSGATVQTPTNELSKLTAATANTFTVKQVIEVTDNTNAALRITQLGTADALRVEDSTNPDSTPFIIDASGNVGIGTTALLGTYGKLRVAGTSYQAINVGSDDASGVNIALGANSSTDARLNVVTNHPLLIYTNNTERARVDASGNVLVTSSGGLGYGTGSGGTVTQLTSKNTPVTLNKTNGQITMNNAALAAGASISFQFNNTTIAATDVVIAHPGNFGTYTASTYFVTAGACGIRVTNISGGSLSEAVTINFAVIKATTS